MWFLCGKVRLTKDNLIKCWFRDSSETVQQFFISYPFVSVIWCMTYFTYNLPPPTNITNMFGYWLNGVLKDVKARIRIGISVVCWSILACCNNIIFNKQKDTNFCSLFNWLRTGFIYGPTSSLWISGSIWLLVATGYCRLLGTFFPGYWMAIY
jgi:hypothetical protein